jgi:allophanate hydrolase
MTSSDSLRRRAGELAACIDRAERAEVWISRVGIDALAAAIEEIDRRAAAGEDLPLAGLTFAVKDNIDVAGVPTTAGCPAFATMPAITAPAVTTLLEAGALFVGKTNLDQFATGLVGTRSPYGPVRNAVSPEHISGGSSSGSAVAVALGLVDFALGTDTAGSGRVPAALNGIVGIKPTRGLVSTTGVVPACRSFDCVTVVAATVDLGERVLAVLAAPDLADARRRSVPPNAPLAPPARPVVARAGPQALGDLDPARLRAYEDALQRLEDGGCRTAVVDIEPFLDAGRLLYEGGFLAERHAAVGAWVDDHLDQVDPVVGPIISAAGLIPAERLAADTDRLGLLAKEAEATLAAVGACSLVLPTAPLHPTIAEVAGDPVGVNSRMGRYTTFVNLLDWCAVAVPAGKVGELPFGISLIGPAWSDLVQADLARIVEGTASLGHAAEAKTTTRHATVCQRPPFPAVALAVVGAHLTGQPLNHQLTDRGARLLRSTATAAEYRLHALNTEPPKPGLVRVAAGGAGASIEVEVWELPPVGFADLVAALPPPMAVGPVRLADGSQVTGFLCEPIALEGAPDVSSHGGWLAYLAAR